MATENRIAATIQFVRGKDDDLIAWLNRQEKGNWNQAIKSALRSGLNMPVKAAQVSDDELRVYVAQLDSDYRQRMEAIDEALAILTGRMEQIGSPHYNPADHPSALSEAPRISDEEKQQRKQRMLQQKW
jgi:formiminotetrahydrofolate cyclodeaminase